MFNLQMCIIVIGMLQSNNAVYAKLISVSIVVCIKIGDTYYLPALITQPLQLSYYC